MDSKKAMTAGLLSSIAVAAVVSIFAVLLIAGFWTDTNNLSYLVCFFLPPVFLLMQVSLYTAVNRKKRFFAVASLAFAALYTVFCMASYYILLTVVRANTLKLPPEIIRLLSFTPGSAVFSADMLGYGFLCLSALFMGLALDGGKKEKRLKFFSLINGAFLIPTWIYPALSFPQDAASVNSGDVFGSIALLAWCVVFLPVPVFSFLYFKRKLQKK